MPALATWAAMPDPITPEPITATFLISVMVGCPGSDGFENGVDALAAADALGGERELLAFALQQRCRLAGDARAGGAPRMAERDGAAVEVDLAHVVIGLLPAAQRQCRSEGRRGGEGGVGTGGARWSPLRLTQT